jgi:tetratricopeptide (TPR) repeat protein
VQLELESARKLFRSGRFVELVSRLGTAAELRNSEPELRVLAAHAFFHAADTEASERLVLAENNESSAITIRAHCEQVLGLLRRRQGAISTARNHFRNAIQLAKEGRDDPRAAWASLQLFRTLAESEPAVAISGILPEVRNLAARAADLHVNAYLHDSIALMEVANGRLGEAHRHLKVARSLLDSEPNAWLLQVIEVSSFFVAFLENDYSGASGHLKNARKLLSIVGEQDKHLIECNEAHALIVLGKFDGAMVRLEQVVESTAVRPALAALEGMARVFLATGRLEQCELVLARYEEGLQKRAGIETEFVGRWTAVTRLKLLIRKRCYREAADYASEAIERARLHKDRLLLAFLGALRAEALALCGNAADASREIAALTTAEEVTPDQYAAFCRAASVILHESHSPLACVWSERATSIWQAEGNACAVAELVPTLRSEECTLTPVHPDVGAAIVSSLTSALTLIGRRRLLARELQTALRLAGFSKRIDLIDSERRRQQALSDERLYCVNIGEDSGRELTLAFEVPTSPPEALLIGDVVRLAKAANALDRLGRQDRDRAALWPADPIETEAGALFLAEEMQSILGTARRVADSTIPVLITGETGTGKEVLARLIHAYSKRATAAFVPFNCSAVPKDMLDSQLFGHRRGSFTGAAENFQGVIRAPARRPP